MFDGYRRIYADNSNHNIRMKTKLLRLSRNHYRIAQYKSGLIFIQERISGEWLDRTAQIENIDKAKIHLRLLILDFARNNFTQPPKKVIHL